jgi:tetratricopeptide (TPR) repeat protein
LDEDERLLKEREETLKNDRRRQAEWYESLNLYAEAMRIYESIRDSENIERLKEKMRTEYGKNANILEKQGRFQDAANLYYLIGDHHSVGRMKELDPNLVILYDSEGEGLAKLAGSLDDLSQRGGDVDLFSEPNKEEEEDPAEAEPKEDIPKKEIPIKKPAKRKEIQVPASREKRIRFCPYCGEELSTRKEPRFCPYCGEDLS